MKNVKIYNANHSLLLDLPVDDSSFQYKKIMAEDSLTLNFSLGSYIDVPIGAYCDFKAERHTLFAAASIDKHNSGTFVYSLKMGGYQDYLKFVKYKFFTVERNPGQPDKMVGAPKLKFSLTATPDDFAQLLVDCLNIEGSGGWIKGECLQADPVTIDFNHDDCRSVAQKIADAFGTEWEFIGMTFYVRKVERLDNDGNRISFPLAYGYGRGILGYNTATVNKGETPGIGIKRTQYDSKNVINRIWIQGGDRNINYKSYGNDTLLMPRDSVFLYEGIQYRTDPTGAYVERADREGVLSEDSLDVSTIYPHREGTVTAVEMVNDAKGRYNIIDADIPEPLNYLDMIIPGNTMTVIFQTGPLAGQEFEVKYTHSARRFELQPIDNNGLVYPQGSIIPAVGDTYGVFHISLPQDYIDTAEIAARDEAVKYLFENSVPRLTYKWQMDSMYAAKHWGEIGGYLSLGYFVAFTDAHFLDEETDIRIVSVKTFVNRPRLPIIEIANNLSGSSLGNILNEIPAQEQATDRKDNDVMNYVRRNFRDVKDTIEALEEAQLDFGESISPITIQTMLALVGDESLQFRFVNGMTSPQPVIYNITFSTADKKLRCPAGIIQHMTLGIDSISPSHIDSEYHFWDMREFVSDTLTQETQRYYLYAHVERNGGDGVFLISPTAIVMEAEAGYYHLLVGILNPEYDDNRSFAPMFGFTEILPGRITTDRIVSSDGLNYIDLLHNALKLTNGMTGNNDQTLDWSSGTLTITNATIKNSLKVLGEALIAGFLFSDQVIKSSAMTNGKPAMTLDGINSLIELISSKTPIGGGDGEAKESTISLSAKSGEIIAKTDHSNYTMIGANGIEATSAGMNIASYLTGQDGKVNILATIRGKLTSNYENSNFMTAVLGMAYNDESSNPAPAYGGWFEQLKVHGLIKETQRILDDGNDSEIQLYSNTSLVVSLKTTSKKPVRLPADAYVGYEIEFRQVLGSRIRIYPPTGQYICNDRSPDDYFDVTEGCLAKCMFVGEVATNGSTKKMWTFNLYKY